ncbi:hypothetical protein EN935_14130 [Mesorhizobium sp. M7D.F.Ca.US.004.03.1.1]|uniref:hypothetical protein n=2 Tax=unclassified Mesorhizobium TaxID=325217 RepID=UPI000FCAC098|nr:hypothetical protein [Mesorhizobium sp. M7D.F.Ca.US.004.03.1.1]RVA31033.1 hypothetical protein EN935_14130 [Mesorhizobium sp. M7D.F.Ca.US.004.03.1.1]
MTIRYVRSAAAGSANGTSWANAYTTITSAFAAGAAGDTYYVSEDHAESTASNVAPNSKGTLANPTFAICVDHTGSVPPVVADLRTTAQVNTTGFSNAIFFNGSTVYYGIIFTSGSASITLASSSAITQKFINCSLRIAGGNSSDALQTSAGVGQRIELINTTVSFSSGFHTILMTCDFIWRDTPSALLGTMPTKLFTLGSGGKLKCQGVDLSASGSGNTIVGTPSSNTTGATAELIDCKTNAAVTIAAVPQSHGQIEIDAMRVGSTGVNYNQYRGRYTGSLVEETTIVHTGGASNGTTPISWKIVTTANATWHFPFEAPPIAIWNDTTGSAVTATVECRAAAIPNDDELWLEVEYLGDASSPQASFVSDVKATLLTAAAAQASSSESWGGSTASFKLDVTFTPQQKGWVLARVKAGKASSTFYVDPKVTLT